MPAIKCPFCQHENKPGTRFCSECGASIHLKICSNPACGKISDVSAAVCEFCSQAFPNAEAAPVEAMSSDVSVAKEEPANSSTSTEKKQSGTRAWPLITVALVAGGLPMLWANRAQLPTPRTWQMTSPEVQKAAGSDPALSIKIEPLAPASPAPAPVPTKEAVTGDTSSVAVGSTATVEPKTSKKKSARTKPVTTDIQGNRVKETPVIVSEPPRPCTEATVALGLLCDPKQTAK